MKGLVFSVSWLDMIFGSLCFGALLLWARGVAVIRVALTFPLLRVVVSCNPYDSLLPVDLRNDSSYSGRHPCLKLSLTPEP